MVRFIHTADLQIGMPFQWASDRARQKLREHREETIDTLARLAEAHDVDFVVVAGDFFDANTVGDDVVMRACERLKSVPIPTYILPGNHDFGGGPDSVFRRTKFVNNKPRDVHILDDRAPVLANGDDVVLLPAPLLRRHATGDTTSHITESFGREMAPDAIRIGIAHGGVTDFSEGDAVNRIDPDRARKAGLDYLALGDWHGLKHIDDRTWYSGTPEPTSFRQNGPGHVLLVEIAEPGALPQVTPVAIAHIQWISHEAQLHAIEDVSALMDWFDKVDRPLQKVVQLRLEGGLGLTDLDRLRRLVSDIEDTVLELRIDNLSVAAKPSPEELESLDADGYVGLAVARLHDLSESGNEAAGRALELLYHHKMES